MEKEVKSKKEQSRFACNKIPKGTRFYFNCKMFEYLYMKYDKKNKGEQQGKKDFD